MKLSGRNQGVNFILGCEGRGGGSRKQFLPQYHSECGPSVYDSFQK